MSDFNMNDLVIPGDCPGNGAPLADLSRDQDSVTCYFRNLERRLVERIEEADFVFGCVAWLTNEPVLRALAKKKGVSFLVQKEDFLRPDAGTWSSKKLRSLYQRLRGVDRHDFTSGIASQLSVCSDPDIAPVRCVGIRNNKKAMAAPRMHHKFALFCKAVEAPPDDLWNPGRRWALPYEVWTGSFNWTKNASNSLENAVVIRDPKIAKVYYLEFQQTLGLSEPLDWDSEWVDPEWRIGT